MKPHPLPAARAARLRRGINLSHWFSQVYWEPGYTQDRFDSYIRLADIALIRDMGFDHVRFPINCEPMIAAAGLGGGLPRAWIDRIRARVAEMHDHGLAVIIDIHPEDPFKHALARSDEAVVDLVSFWSRFAAELRELDPERTVLEALNEPCIHDAGRWHRIQNTLVKTIRSAAPRHTIVVTGDKWSLLPELLELTPPEDDNLIANFHLYDPHVFSHQGAHWVGPWAPHVHDLNYPADAADIAAQLAHVTDPEAREKLAAYLAEGWNADVYRRFVQPAADWAEARGLPLICNEFGVYKEYSPRDSRLRCLRDMSSALAAAGIGWTMWDYAGDFATVRPDARGIREPDTEVATALGLSSPVPSFA